MSIILQNFTEHKQGKIKEAFDTLGLPATKPIITTSNRAIVRGFLNGLGFATETYLNASIEELQNAYHSTCETGLGLIPFICYNDKLSVIDIHDNIIECRNRIKKSDYSLHMQYAITTDDIENYLTRNPIAEKIIPPVEQSKLISQSNDVTKQATDAIAALIASVTNKPQELDESKVIALIKQHSLSTSITLKTENKTSVIPTGLHHKVLPDIITFLNAGINVYMVGAAGSGKTTIAEQAAHALNLPFYFNGALDSEYKLTGFIDAKGCIVSTAFRRAYENGGVYLFDEVDASLPSALLAFNAALANGHTDFPDCSVKKHADFKCIAAANTFGKGADRQYVGRNQLDAATLDRFAFIEVDYDHKLERALTQNDDWCDYVQAIRKAVFSLKIRHVVSPRASINGAKLLAAGVSKDKVIDSVIWKGLDSDTVYKIKQAA